MPTAASLAISKICVLTRRDVIAPFVASQHHPFVVPGGAVAWPGMSGA